MVDIMTPSRGLTFPPPHNIDHTGYFSYNHGWHVGRYGHTAINNWWFVGYMRVCEGHEEPLWGLFGNGRGAYRLSKYKNDSVQGLRIGIY